MVKPISVYDGHTRKRLAYLQNAYDISYHKDTNNLWTGEFSLPYSDPKVKYCEAFNLVELWDEDAGGKHRNIGLFRIMPRTEEALGTEANIVFQLEHVLSTLLDDVMLGYHEIGNVDVYTDMSIAYILENQTDKRWILKQCDYQHEFLYGWQDENLLSALFSIVQPFEETDYYWYFDTSVFPWELSLLQTEPTPKTDIRYKKNLHGLTRVVDPTNLTTRLYCYGYGDGDNKLGIAEVNNGIPYLESPNVAKYGVITQIWTDERFTIAESLFAIGGALLKRLEEPAVTYELDIQTISNAANLTIGDVVRVVSVGLDELMTVKSISKDDVTGAPQSGKIELGQGTIDISSSLAELADRQRIAETYSQGAESIFTDSFSDNADPTNPAEITFIIPENVVHVNEIMFNCNLTNFRAYSKAIQGGGAGDDTTLDGGGAIISSGAGGNNLLTSQGGGAGTRTSYDGGGSTISSEDGGGTTRTTTTKAAETETFSIYNLMPDSSDNVHNHGISAGTRLLKSGGGDVGWTLSGAHRHQVTIPSHNHNVTIPEHNHRVGLPNHRHDIYIPEHTHGVNIPTHTHQVNVPAHKHQYSLPNHTHGIEYGIYRGPAGSAMSIYLDDTLVGEYGSSVSKINLIDYMSKNANGDIMRGDHVIRVVPNGLTRVQCIFQVRLFTNMHGGKQY